MPTKKAPSEKKPVNRSYYARISTRDCDSGISIYCKADPHYIKKCKCCFEGKVVATSIKEAKEIIQKFKKWKNFPKESRVKVVTGNYYGPGDISEKKKGVYKFKYVKDNNPVYCGCFNLTELKEGWFDDNGKLYKELFVKWKTIKHKDGSSERLAKVYCGKLKTVDSNVLVFKI